MLLNKVLHDAVSDTTKVDSSNTDRPIKIISSNSTALFFMRFLSSLLTFDHKKQKLFITKQSSHLFAP